MVDYLQLVRMERRRSNRVEEVSEISRELKLLAKDLNCPVLALSQLNRAVEQRQDKRPSLSDLRESGALEQDAEAVMLLFRQDYYDDLDGKPVAEREHPGLVELITPKGRNEGVSTTPLYYRPDWARWDDIERRQDRKGN